MSEATLKVDAKGRIVIPSKIRRELGIRSVVSMRVHEGEVTLKPVKDPLESLAKLVVKGTEDVEREIGRLRRAAERELLRED